MNKLFLMITCIWLSACTQPATPTLKPSEVISYSTETSIPLPATPTSPNDCSLVAFYQPDSAEAQEIAAAFVADFRAQWPTEYMAFEPLWGVYQQGNYLVIEGGVTDEEIDLILIQKTPNRYQVVVRYTNHQGKHSAGEIRDILFQQAPEAPATLIECADVSRFVQ